MPAPPPAFIIGVPRSGTTLVRTILDSHSAIACGPETPWLAGHQPRSVMELWRFLCESTHGYAASFGMPTEVVTSAAWEFVDRLLGEYARSRGKRRWAEKTPDNIWHLEFLRTLCPQARFVLVIRDGLDVALSTSVVEPHRAGISAFHEQFLSLSPALPPVPNTAWTALLRWRHWNRLAERALAGAECIRIEYEDLVRSPGPTVRRLVEFLGEEFEPAMLGYDRFPHDYPSWEWGSADVRSRRDIEPTRAGRARRELDAADLAILAPLNGPPATGAGPEPQASLASVGELQSRPYTRFMEWLNGLAAPLGLQEFRTWSKVWEYPWLWLGRLDRIDWAGARLVDLGSALSPMPWVCALLGAKVTLIEASGKFEPLWTRLRDGLRVDLDWRIADDEHIPLGDATVDVVTSFSVVEHLPDKAKAVAEVARVLRPRGVFGVSFDVCEADQGMTFPDWNGRALTLRQFEELLWRHPSFDQDQPLRWSTEDVPEFLRWHRQTAPHHNYIVGAALLRKVGG